MTLDDLFETASLPLLPKQLPRMRGSYGAFIISMRPEDFLALTTSDADELKSIIDKPFPHSRDDHVERRGHDEDFGRYDMPYLNVHFPSGRVFGHEGRHRTAMVMRHGGHSIPVTIYPYEENEFAVTVSYYDLNSDEDGKTVEEIGIFNDYAEAEQAGLARKVELAQNEDFWSPKVSIERAGGGKLKGAPARSDGWDKAAWKIGDFPKQLLGQYDGSVVVTRFKIGLVKGYRHFVR